MCNKQPGLLLGECGNSYKFSLNPQTLPEKKQEPTGIHATCVKHPMVGGLVEWYWLINGAFDPYHPRLVYVSHISLSCVYDR